MNENSVCERGAVTKHIECPDTSKVSIVHVHVKPAQAIARVPEHLIRYMGRWRSDAVLQYIRIDPQQAMSVSSYLATAM